MSGLSEAEKKAIDEVNPKTVPQEELKVDPAKVVNQKMSTVAQPPTEEGEEEEGGGEEEPSQGGEEGTVKKEELKVDPAEVAKNKFKGEAGTE